ncbi:MAG: hypothetical protein ABH823_03880 [bacterium]
MNVAGLTPALTRAVKASGQNQVLHSPGAMQNPAAYYPIIRAFVNDPQASIPFFGLDRAFERGLFTGLESACQEYMGTEVKARAEALLHSHFQSFFTENEYGRSVIEFAQHLVDEFLTNPDANATLVFHLMGASGLAQVTRLLTPEHSKTRVIGLHLNRNTMDLSVTEKRILHPRLVHYLWQEQALTSEQVVFVDVGYNGQQARVLRNLLENYSLIKYVQEELDLRFTRNSWQTATRLYCLRSSRDSDPGAWGFNSARPELSEETMLETAYVIDDTYLDRPSEVEKLEIQDDKVVIIGQASDTRIRQIMEEEMLRAAA